MPQPDGGNDGFQIGKLEKTPQGIEEAVQRFYAELLKKSHFFWPSLLRTAILVAFNYKGEDKHSEPSDVDSSPIF